MDASFPTSAAPATAAMSKSSPSGRTLRVHAVAMIRNDADIIMPFLRQCAELFDSTYIIDIQSTDGTKEAIEAFDAGRGRIKLFTAYRQEKFQGAMMNTLTRRAFADGADWVFLLDADEFLDVPSRAALNSYLDSFNADVMHLAWINLVPTDYGSFSDFEPDQTYHWSGRTSIFNKVAISNLFAASNPDYHIYEGNHHIAPRRGAPEVPTCFGLSLLHVPIRSAPRFKYKISGALRITRAKHNRLAGEGVHVETLDRLLASNITSAELNDMAGHYGQHTGPARDLLPAELEWPAKRLPRFVQAGFGEPEAAVLAADCAQTLLRDSQVTWDQTSFAPHSPVAAWLDGDTVLITPQPLYGSGRPRQPHFERLGDKPADPRDQATMLTDAADIACMRIRRFAFSAWSELIPVLSCLFSALRPRRYVELGVHNGMSFFAACQAKEHLGLDTECVAVDSWIGDEHAGFHTDEVFTNFKAYCAENHPDQVFIQSYFESALQCFEDGSIDLLHIDGLHTYDAVKQDFETWLPKLSDTGVIMFHDTNVLDREFGVWRLWNELRQRYPSFNFLHKHGLGIIYVGTAPSPVAALLNRLSSDPAYTTLAQTFFRGIGTLAVEHRTTQWEVEGAKMNAAALQQRAGEAEHRAHHLSQEGEQLRSSVASALNMAQIEAEQLHAVLSSSTWRATSGMRRALSRFPLLRRIVRAPARLVWRTVIRPIRYPTR